MSTLEIAYRVSTGVEPPRPSGNLMVRLGPQCQVRVGVPAEFATALQQDGRAVPAAITCLALIDTGAARTAIDERIVHELGLPPTQLVNVHTAAGVHSAGAHAVQISIPALADTTHLVPEAVACRLADLSFRVLLGCDLLSHLMMTYDGPGGIVTLDSHAPRPGE